MSVDTSVIITNHNRKDFLGRAIRSCLKQSLEKSRFEVIVVDDASTDKSQDVICGFKDKIVPIYLDTNVGVAEASNVGIKNALGSYVIRVDSDDYINENTLLFMTEILNANHDIGFVYSDHLRVDKDERILERVDLNTVDKIFRHGAGIMFRKSYLETIGLYDPEFKNAEDFELLTRYFKNFNGYHLRMPLYRYRIHDGNMTKNEDERKQWETKANAKNKNRK
jgi:glycosyltransferase involved in cell wall biosynthesis